MNQPKPNATRAGMLTTVGLYIVIGAAAFTFAEWLRRESATTIMRIDCNAEYSGPVLVWTDSQGIPRLDCPSGFRVKG